MRIAVLAMVWAGLQGGVFGASNSVPLVYPQALTFSVSSEGGTLDQTIYLGILAGTPIKVASSSWITVQMVGPTGNLTTLDTYQTPALLNVHVMPPQQTGTYIGSITISLNGIDLEQVPVTLTVLTLNDHFVINNPVSVCFGCVFINPSYSQTVSTHLDYFVSFNASVTTGAPWLTASNSSSVANSQTNVTLTANPQSFQPGVYSTSATLTTTPIQPTPFPEPSSITASIPATLVVAGSTSITSITNMNFSATAGGAAPAQTVQAGKAGQSFNLSTVTADGGDWLQVMPNSIVSGAWPLSVTAQASKLAGGTYRGAILLTTNGMTQVVPVVFTVGAAGTGNVTVSPAALIFGTQEGSTASSTQSVQVTPAAGSGNVNFTISATTTSGANWLSAGYSASAAPTSLPVAANPSGLKAGTYTGNIAVAPSGGATVSIPVTLTVSPAAISASPASVTFSYQVGNPQPAAQTLQVGSGGAALTFAATVVGGTSWLTVLPSAGTTPAPIQVSVDASSLNVGTYSASIMINGSAASGTGTLVSVQVTLNVTTPAPVIIQVSNAASYTTGGISPGEIVVIQGTGIGPAVAAQLSLDSTGKVATIAGGVQVLLNSVAAPIIYASSTQVNAIVPYEATQVSTAAVAVHYLGQTSNLPTLEVQAAVPGIFTANASGTGPAAIVNQDGTYNSPSNPAAPGDIVLVYLTGEGQTNPGGVTGKINCLAGQPCSIASFPVPTLPVTVTIDGQPATYSFAAEAPNAVSGLMQINLQIPMTLPRPGDLPLVVSLGDHASQNGVTISVRR